MQADVISLYDVSCPFEYNVNLESNREVLLVPTEEEAVNARKVLHIPVLAWQRSDSTARRFNLQEFRHKRIFLYPFTNRAGLSSAAGIARLLNAAGVHDIRIVRGNYNASNKDPRQNKLPIFRITDDMNSDHLMTLRLMIQDDIDAAVDWDLIRDQANVIANGTAASDPSDYEAAMSPMRFADSLMEFVTGAGEAPPELTPMSANKIKSTRNAQLIAAEIRSIKKFCYWSKQEVIQALIHAGFEDPKPEKPEGKSAAEIRADIAQKELAARLNQLHAERGESSAHKLACSILEKYDRPTRVGAAEQSHILLNWMEEKSATALQDIKVSVLQPGGFGKNSIFDWVKVNEQHGTYQVIEPGALASELKPDANEYLSSYGMSPKFAPNALCTLLPMAAYKYDRIKTRSFGFYREDGKYDHYVTHRIGFSEHARKAAKDKPDGINKGTLQGWIAKYCPHWGEFLSRNSKPLTFMSWVGAVFDEDVRHLQQAFFLQGDGNDGKSNVAGLIGEALGDACFQGMWDGGRFNSHLHNKRMYVVQEMHKPDITSDPLFKIATGDKRISLERKGVDKVQVENEIHILACMNGQLQIGNQRAERRRVLISSVRAFDGIVDRSITEHLRDELDCFLIACRWAWDTWHINKTLVPLDLEGEQFTAEQDKDSAAWDEARDWFDVHFEFRPNTNTKIKKARLTEILIRDNKGQVFQRKLRDWLIKQGCREERDEQSRYWVGFAEISAMHHVT